MTTDITRIGKTYIGKGILENTKKRTPTRFSPRGARVIISWECQSFGKLTES
jgi:hypothetical protein